MGSWKHGRQVCPWAQDSKLTMVGKGLLIPFPEKSMCFTVSAQRARSISTSNRTCVQIIYKDHGATYTRVPPMSTVPIKTLASSQVLLKASWTGPGSSKTTRRVQLSSNHSRCHQGSCL